MFTMAHNKKKQVVCTVMKGLFHLLDNDLFQLATTNPRTPDKDTYKLNKDDEKGCIYYVCTYMSSTFLWELEDKGILQLLFLRDMIVKMTCGHEQGELSTEGEINVIVFDANVLSPSPPNVVHINTHTTGPHAATDSDLTSQTSPLELQQNKLISSHMNYQKLKPGNVSLTLQVTDAQPTDNNGNHSNRPNVMWSPR